MPFEAPLQSSVVDYTHFHLFCGVGGGAEGFNNGTARVGERQAKLRCVGGIDVDKDAIRNFTARAGVAGTAMDLFTRDQYRAFHGTNPPAHWREATIDDIRRAAHFEFPDIVFLSAPCKGFSGLLSESTSMTAKYQALNELTLRGVWLMLEAFRDKLPRLIIFENVPRIMQRGRRLLSQIKGLLRHYGYMVAETVHDCGEIAGLAQSRKRFLMVCRHSGSVPNYLYEPEKLPLRGVGEVLDLMPLPGDPIAGPMHRVPNLSWKTWCRLAFVEAGGDWRSLQRLEVEDGYLKDYLIVPEERGYRRGYLGVHKWEEPSGTLTGRSSPTTGAFSVADIRPPHNADQYGQYGVMRMDETAGTVTTQRSPGQGTFSVADPRMTQGPGAHTSKFRIVPYNRPAGVVTGTDRVGSGAQCVADPRPAKMRGERDHYNTQAHYGVMRYSDTSRAVPAFACQDNGAWSVADPRMAAILGNAGDDAIIMPKPDDRLACIITALDGTWHRPLTTLELAALQSLVDPANSASWRMFGSSDGQWREQIGNAVPPAAAAAIASVMAKTLLLADMGETFSLSNAPIWVQPMAIGLSLDTSMMPN